MKVLLIGHACGPGMGSEPGGTWNWAQHLSKGHQVWVITHPQFRSKIEAYLLDHPNPNVHFVWVDAKSILDPWRPARGERGIQIHYLFWLHSAYAKAQTLCQEIGFDVVHHVSWGTLRAPPPLGKLNVPSFWGPLGGAQCAPLSFLTCFGWSAWREVFRMLSVRALSLSPSLRNAARNSANILTTNRETEQLLTSIGAERVESFLDCGLPASWVSASPPAARSPHELTLLWVGRLEPRKALVLALQALAKIPQVPARLLIAGSGPLRSQLEALSKKLGLANRVTFLGYVPYEEMQSLFRSADVFLFTSLRDSFGSVVLEAMAQGLPIVTLDHQGVGTFVPQDAGIKVPVTNPSDTVQSLAAAIRRLCESPALLPNMQLAAWNFAREQTWDRRVERMRVLYEEAMSRHHRSSASEWLPTRNVGTNR